MLPKNVAYFGVLPTSGITQETLLPITIHAFEISHGHNLLSDQQLCS